jgi:hypothetical protein
MQNEENKKVEENFKELLNEVSKIGECIEEIESIEQEKTLTDNNDTVNEDENKNTSQNNLKFIPDDENLQEYVYKSATDLIDSSLYTLDKVKKSVTSVMDHRELTSLAELIKATTSSIDILNKVVMENKKLKNAKEIKKMDIEAKKEIGNTKIKNQTNILVASREEILKKLIDKTDLEVNKEDEKIINIEN